MVRKMKHCFVKRGRIVQILIGSTLALAATTAFCGKIELNPILPGPKSTLLGMLTNSNSTPKQVEKKKSLKMAPVQEKKPSPFLKKLLLKRVKYPVLLKKGKDKRKIFGKIPQVLKGKTQAPFFKKGAAVERSKNKKNSVFNKKTSSPLKNTLFPLPQKAAHIPEKKSPAIEPYEGLSNDSRETLQDFRALGGVWGDYGGGSGSSSGSWSSGSFNRSFYSGGSSRESSYGSLKDFFSSKHKNNKYFEDFMKDSSDQEKIIEEIGKKTEEVIQKGNPILLDDVLKEISTVKEKIKKSNEDIIVHVEESDKKVFDDFSKKDNKLENLKKAEDLIKKERINIVKELESKLNLVRSKVFVGSVFDADIRDSSATLYNEKSSFGDLFNAMASLGSIAFFEMVRPGNEALLEFFFRGNLSEKQKIYLDKKIAELVVSRLNLFNDAIKKKLEEEIARRDKEQPGILRAFLTDVLLPLQQILIENDEEKKKLVNEFLMHHINAVRIKEILSSQSAKKEDKNE